MYFYHYYNNDGDFQDDYWGTPYHEPWVSKTVLEGNPDHRVNYNKKMKDGYLTFDVKSSGNIKWKCGNSSYAKEIEYKKNDDDWTSITSTTGGVNIPVNAGDKVMFRGDNVSYGVNPDFPFTGGSTFNGTNVTFDVYGNAMSLIDSENFSTMLEFPDRSVSNFAYLFSACTGLQDASQLNLPVMVLTDACYAYMFYGCDHLTVAPTLPSKILAKNCYYFMFSHCNRLREAPELKAVTLAGWCYEEMFSYCTSLTRCPDLIGRNTPSFCCKKMFLNCTSLVQAPSIINGPVAEQSCFTSMFENCTSLTEGPDLPAKEVHGEAYRDMFKNCTSLTGAPNIAAERMVLGTEEDYHGDIGELGIRQCYGMFSGCTALIVAPSVLKSTVLTKQCYLGMFSGCNKLTQAPELPAIDLDNSGSECCNNMFDGCSVLSCIKCLAISTGKTSNWVRNVGWNGIFIKAAGTNWPKSNTGIPTNWVVVNDGESALVVNGFKVIYGQNNTFTVASTGPWTATVSDNWIVMSQTTGDSGATEISVECTGTTSTGFRQGTITIGDNVITVYQADVPAGYTKVRKLTSTSDGGQYIKTGLKIFDVAASSPVQYTLIGKAKIIGQGLETESQGTLVTTQKEVSPYVGFSIRQNANNVEYRALNGSKTYPSSIGNNFMIDITQPSTVPQETHDVPLTLFCALDANGAPWRYTNSDLYYLHITSNAGNMFFVPCLDNNDVPGLYDAIGRTFYKSGSENPFSYTA